MSSGHSRLNFVYIFKYADCTINLVGKGGSMVFNSLFALGLAALFGLLHMLDRDADDPKDEF